MRKIIPYLNVKLMVFAFVCFIYSCTNNENRVNNQVVDRVQCEEFQQIIDSANVNGSILFYNANTDKFYSNNFDWAEKQFLPASTFKITNSIIALETGLIEDDSTLIEWDGEERAMEIWEQDLIFRDAFHYSCVPCYQEIARNIGVERMNEYLEKFNYGNMIVNDESIDIFWLEGESGISQFEQIEFLRKLYNSELPISADTEKIMKRLMVIDENSAYTISGKTGWSIRNGNNNGWFVGYFETQKNVWYFATNISPSEEFNMDLFPVIRKDITFKAFEQITK